MECTSEFIRLKLNTNEKIDYFVGKGEKKKEILYLTNTTNFDLNWRKCLHYAHWIWIGVLGYNLSISHELHILLQKLIWSIIFLFSFLFHSRSLLFSIRLTITLICNNDLLLESIAKNLTRNFCLSCTHAALSIMHKTAVWFARI